MMDFDSAVGSQSPINDLADALREIERLRRALEEHPSVDDTAPIARLIVQDDRIASATMYAPGLPDGEHDVWPCPVVAAEKPGAEAWAIFHLGQIDSVYPSRTQAEQAAGDRSVWLAAPSVRHVTITVLESGRAVMNRREAYPDPETEPKEPTYSDIGAIDDLADILREDRIERDRLDRLEQEEARREAEDAE